MRIHLIDTLTVGDTYHLQQFYCLFFDVMYAGRVVEKGTVREIFTNPCHPYTIGLMASKPVVGKQVDRLYSIPGKVPNPVNMPDYCYYKDRCEILS